MCILSLLELLRLPVIAGDKMCELKVEGGDDDDDGDDGDVCDRSELHEQFVVPYSLHNEIAVATHNTYILHMNANV
jgi:hypothetical protein